MPPSSVTPAARDLQDKLHDLLSRLSGTMDHVKNWPEATDTAVHVESTTRLIQSIRNIIAILEKVEQAVQNDATLKQQLQNCLIPVDLLELLDCGLNPDCFSRGLLREASGQLSGLKRRKQALEMLGSAVQKGLDERDTKKEAVTVVKRELAQANDNANPNGDEPPSKKLKSDPDTVSS